MKTINLEEILLSKFNFTDAMEKAMALQAMKEACKQTLELASQNAEIISIETSNDSSGFIFEINEQSILNTINQIK